MYTNASMLNWSLISNRQKWGYRLASPDIYLRKLPRGGHIHGGNAKTTHLM